MPRFSHHALTLDDGRVLVSGGFTGIANNNVILRIILDTTDVFDPGTGQWSAVPTEVRRSFANGVLKLPDGTVLFVGVDEDSSAEGATGAAYRLNTSDLSWKHLADPPTARAFPRIVLLGDGRVMVAGGFDLNEELSIFSPESTKTVDIFDPAANSWHQAAPISAASEEMWLFPLNDGRVLAIAGEDETSDDSPVHAQLYDPDSDTWAVVDSFEPYYLPKGAVQLSDGRVLVAGTLDFLRSTGRGFSGDLLTFVSLPDGRAYYGDRARDIFPDAMVYDPATDTWTPTLGNPGRRTSASLTLLRDGRVLMAGGEDDTTYDYEPSGKDLGFLSTTAVYDPELNFWSPGPDMAEGRSEHSATLVPDGRVLFLGGIGLTKVSEGREEMVPLKALEFIDSAAIPQADPAALTTLEAEGDLCVTVPIPAPSAEIALARGSLSPKEILGAAHAALSALESYHVELGLTIVDDETGSGFADCRSLVSDFQAPDRVREHISDYGDYGLFGEDLAAEVIYIGATAYYLAEHLTGEWERRDDLLPANPLAIVGDDAIAGLSDVSIEGVERLDNVDVYRIEGTLSFIAFLKAFFPNHVLFGEIRDTDDPYPPLRVVFWVGVDDSLLRKVSAEGVLEDKNSVHIPVRLSFSVTTEYSAFGEEIVIEAPEIGTTP